MSDIPAFISISNGQLHDYEIRYVCDYYADPCVKAVNTHIVRQSKSVKNALASFNRQVPRHGAIKSIRRVVEK